MRVIKAKLNDLESVAAFYEDVIENTPDMERYGRWKKGLYPTVEGIKRFIEDGAMYICLHEDSEEIAGALSITMCQGEDYAEIEWKFNAEDEHVAIVHILAVNPRLQGKGIGRKIVEEAMEIAKKNQKKVIRLDALESNLPARRMYESIGFMYRGKMRLYADNTGWTNFCFFECRLDEVK